MNFLDIFTQSQFWSHGSLLQVVIISNSSEFIKWIHCCPEKADNSFRWSTAQMFTSLHHCSYDSTIPLPTNKLFLYIHDADYFEELDCCCIMVHQRTYLEFNVFWILYQNFTILEFRGYQENTLTKKITKDGGDEEKTSEEQTF